VQPGHWRISHVLMAVEVPSGRKQEVTSSHDDGVAVHHRPDPLTLEDEAERILGVPVLRATSWGPRYWMAAHSVGVANGIPSSPGLATAMARRSPPLPTGTRSPARGASGYNSLHRHTRGRARDVGTFGISSPSCVHSGNMFAAANLYSGSSSVPSPAWRSVTWALMGPRAGRRVAASGRTDSPLPSAR
jgi:hypothetical protein